MKMIFSYRWDWIFKILAGFMLTMTMFAIFAALQYYTNLELADYKDRVVTLATVLGIVFAGFLNGGGKTKGGWFHGSISGLGFLFLLFLMNLEENCLLYARPQRCLFMLLFCTGFGALGGIVGINLKQRKGDGRA